jgi:hypothetical protein
LPGSPVFSAGGFVAASKWFRNYQNKVPEKITFRKKLKFGVETAFLQSGVFFFILDFIRLTARGGLMGVGGF